MESWVSTLIKDIKGKVGFSGNQLTRSNSSENGGSITDIIIPCDYFPSGLSTSELRLLIQYILKTSQITANQNLVNILGRLLFFEDLGNSTLQPCLELDMSRMGHACITLSFKDRSWPPLEGYSFASWFKFDSLSSRLHLLSVSSTDEENPYTEELYLNKDRVLTLCITGITQTVVSSVNLDLDLEEGRWYHIAVVLAPVNDLVAERPCAAVYMYVDGDLRGNGEVMYIPLLVQHGFMITSGMSAVDAKVSGLKWGVRSFYVFDEQLSTECIRFLYSPTTLVEVSDEKMEEVWLEVCGKKLVCAFNATRTEALPDSQSLRLINLVDPEKSFTFSTSGIPRSGHLCGDISICRKCVTGNIIHPFTGIAVVLSLVENAETTDTLHIALTLLASTLHQNPQRAKQMKQCNGYKLLSSFLRSRINLVDVRCLHILFKMTIHVDSSVLPDDQTTRLPDEVSSPEVQTTKILDELYLSEYQEKKDEDTFVNGVTLATIQSSEPPLNNYSNTSLFAGEISNGDLVEHVLLDWEIWVMGTVSIQLEILNFFETLVSVYTYKDHNLVTLREKNIVRLLLLALHNSDIVDLVVLEKFSVLLTVILESKFLEPELNAVTTFMLTTLDNNNHDPTLRNVMLEALLDLQVTILSEETLEKWNSLVSSNLITYFLDEGVHPSTIGWIITILGTCLTSTSSTFALKFDRSGGYQSLIRVLPKFHDSLDVYYTLFCLIFRKPIYPKLPEVGIIDFETLMTSNRNGSDSDAGTSLKFGILLDSIVGMVTSTYDQLRLKPIPVNQNYQTTIESDIDGIEEVDGDGFLQDDDSRRDVGLLGWESAANATSILRFMANLAKIWPGFSMICARVEFLESCVELYFSIVRTYLALKATNDDHDHDHDHHEIATESPLLASEGDDFWNTDSSPRNYPSSSESTQHFMTTTSSRLLREIDSSGYNGDVGSAGATAVLELMSEVLSQSLVQQSSSFHFLTTTLDSVPLNFDSETVLTFKSLCLQRIMNYLERRLLNNDSNYPRRDDDGDYLLWSNLGSFCGVLVDSVYIGVFSQGSSVIRVLEFCLSMVHLVKKDGLLSSEETTITSLPWTGLLSNIWRGGSSRPIDLIVSSTNRVILYCFLPSSFLLITEEHRLIFLELLHAHKEIVFHSGNVDVNLYSSMCITLVSLFRDEKKNGVRNAAIGIMRYLITHCRASLEEILVSKQMQEGGGGGGGGQTTIDVLNGGFDRLVSGNVSGFMEWFKGSEQEIEQVLEKTARIRWSKYIEESSVFPIEKLALLEESRTTRLGKKVEDGVKLDVENREECIARRSDLESKRVGVCSELEKSREMKCESGSRAEDEWRGYHQQLGHEHKLENLSTMAWEDYWPLC